MPRIHAGHDNVVLHFSEQLSEQTHSFYLGSLVQHQDLIFEGCAGLENFQKSVSYRLFLLFVGVIIESGQSLITTIVLDELLHQCCHVAELVLIIEFRKLGFIARIHLFHDIHSFFEHTRIERVHQFE